MTRITRREFLGHSTAVAALAAGVGVSAADEVRRSAVDMVTLGKTGIKASRLGFGTGSRGGRVQRDLGQEGFVNLARYAFDRGIRYFDLADSYRTHPLFKPALAAMPREELYIQTKIRRINAALAV